MYEAELYNELPDNTTIEHEIQDIIHELLLKFNYISVNVGKSYKNAIGTSGVQMGGNESESSAEGVENKNVHHNLRSNYFKKQLKRLALQSSDQDEQSEDGMSNMSLIVSKHPSYKKIKNSVDDSRICHKRDAMEKIAAEFQRKQGESVNSRRAKLEKEVLDMGDIGTIKVEGNTEEQLMIPGFL